MANNGIMYLGILVVTVLSAIGFTSCDERSDDKLRSDGIIGKAKITDCYSRSKGAGVNVDYTFVVAGKTYKGRQSYIELEHFVCRELYYQEVSIIYVKENPDVNKLMISKNDFERLKYPYPDSLKWTERYYPKW
jgi:hypothetical protein